MALCECSVHTYCNRYPVWITVYIFHFSWIILWTMVSVHQSLLVCLLQRFTIDIEKIEWSSYLYYFVDLEYLVPEDNRRFVLSNQNVEVYSFHVKPPIGSIISDFQTLLAAHADQFNLRGWHDQNFSESRDEMCYNEYIIVQSSIESILY